MKSDAAIVVAFGKFAAAGYKQSLFTKELYKELSYTFGFIAHFDREGFFGVRFSSPAAQVETLTIMVEENGHSLTDLEQRLRTMVVARGLVDAARKQLATETEQKERTELARLKAKYEEVDPLS